MLTSFDKVYQSFYQHPRIFDSMKSHLKTGFSFVLCLMLFFSIGCGSSSSGGKQNGSRVDITTESFHIGQQNSEYEIEIEVTGGSGEYKFAADNLPNGLSINTETGIISGIINVLPSAYTITVTATDINYLENYDTKEYIFNVENFVPDAYEPDDNFPEQQKKAADGDDENINTIKPGDDFQIHTLHRYGDNDFAIIDLTEVAINDEILIEGCWNTSSTSINIQLYDADKQIIAIKNNTLLEECSSLFYVCDNLALYYVRVSEFYGNLGDYDLKVQNTGKKITILPEQLPSVPVGETYNEQIIATGGSGEYTFTADNLPGNLFIDQKTGIISGTITANTDDYSINVTVTDKAIENKKEVKNYTFTVYDNLEIVSETLLDAKIGTNYLFNIVVEGGSGDYTFTAVNLPGDLVVNPNNGAITGTVTAVANDYNFLLSVVDNMTNTKKDKNLTLSVVAFYPDVYESVGAGNNTINTANTIELGQEQNHNFNISGDVDFIRLDLTGITAGHVVIINTCLLTTDTNTILSLYSIDKQVIVTDNNSGDGNFSEIVYECTTPGIYYVKVSEAGDSIGDYSIKVKNTGEKIKINTLTIPDIKRGESLNQQILVTGGSTNYTYEISNLPANLTISQTGLITGEIAVNTGSYTFILRVLDNEYTGTYDEVMYTLNVVDFYPDVYESDDSFINAKTMRAGQEQNHNFNNINDIDFIKLDLTDVTSGNIIKIETKFYTKLTNTNLSLYSSDNTLLKTDTNSGDGSYSLLLDECTPGIYYVKVSESENDTGDYSLQVTDCGPKLKISTDSLKDALKNSPYSENIIVEGGSGDFHYTAFNLPGTLTISQLGTIQGNVTAVPGDYVITVIIADNIYTGVTTEKDFALKIVDFYPDAYEPDNSFTESTTILPGQEQNHTFNIQNEYDYFKLDLNSTDIGNLIKIETLFLSEETDTVISLFDNSHELLGTDNNGGFQDYSKYIFESTKKDIFFLNIYEMHGDYGDYAIRVTDCGSRISFITDTLHDVLIGEEYTKEILVSGGTGGYTFTADTLPTGLSINTETGVISGSTDEGAQEIVISITCVDNENTENTTTKNYVLKVVEFYEDAFEPDNDFSSAKVITPGENQNHTFNTGTDVDYFKIDLSSFAGSVIKIKTEFLSKITDTNLILYDSAYNIIKNNNDSDGEIYSKIYFTCTPGIYFVKVENMQTQDSVGDYTLQVTDCGPKVEITTNSLPYSESVTNYNSLVNISGGNNDNHYSIYSGSLPKGLYINPESGQITGISYESNENNFSVKVADVENSENFSIKNLSITAYIGIKITATDVRENVYWVSSSGAGGEGQGWATFMPTVTATQNLKYVLENMPTELIDWSDDTYFLYQNPTPQPVYTMNSDTGKVMMRFFSITHDTIIRHNYVNYYTWHVTYKVYDVDHPENFDYFDYIVDMQYDSSNPYEPFPPM